jgi:protein TonB
MRLRLVFAALVLLGLGACASGYGDTPENPIHITRPTREEIMAHYPPDALAQGVSGSALVECEVVSGGVLDHCRVVQETPAGQGFGEAAVQVAFEHHVQPDANGRMPVGRRIELPVTFAPPR